MAQKPKQNTSSSGTGLPGTRGPDDMDPIGGGGPVKVELQRTARVQTADQSLWMAVRNRSKAIAFPRYHAFIDAVLCDGEFGPPDAERAGGIGAPTVQDRRSSLTNRKTILGTDSYKLLRQATEAFLIVECGLFIKDGEIFNENSPFAHFDALRDVNGEAGRLEVSEDTVRSLMDALEDYVDAPNTYLRRIATAIAGTQSLGDDSEVLPYCDGILRHRLTNPCMIELIWSYWHEQGMLVQSMNAILKRFQNKRNGPDDPLLNFELDPLRGLNNLLWGFLQDESNRLSVSRRAYEYDHHYGLTLIGKTVEHFTPADSRVRFIEAFHTLLYRAMMFYREDDDTTVIADGFALLNALREVHIILGEGAHNQYGDLPWQARKEMLITQWLLSRPEIREFIRGRHMVPYQESWMGPVDDMKRLQGWTDVSVTHFHELGEFGEQILLSVRFGNWMLINDQNSAKNWARDFRPEIQRYIHAYASVTGVDLSIDLTDSRGAEARIRQPSELMAARSRTLPRTSRASHALPRPRGTAMRSGPNKPRLPVRR
ncbi:hypothetical protein [Palleronia pelagia]|uniref:Uncharacterized protein n=1 Tax=Palleronia pelagia TaxID=387096 RepID=A0A1H8LCH1_9RHOB|nr:hypothetical protein [Palleronia pelagia]SEO02852.1 hypothetical protein SAMN04488011_11016 [Palleronia pelagia]